MGRFIHCRINGEWKSVWKYRFAIQPSEMGRIYHELGLGEYKYIVGKEYEKDGSGNIIKIINKYSDNPIGAMADEIKLTRSDVPELNDWIEILKDEIKRDSDKWYIAMLEAIIKFMIEHPDRQEFIFEGEL